MSALLRRYRQVSAQVDSAIGVHKEIEVTQDSSQKNELLMSVQKWMQEERFHDIVGVGTYAT